MIFNQHARLTITLAAPDRIKELAPRLMILYTGIKRS